METYLNATRKVISMDTGYQTVSQKVDTPEALLIIQPAVQKIAEPSVAAAEARHQTTSSSLTLIALRSETIYSVSSYWLDGDNLDYILPSGTQAACALDDLDLARTTQLNAWRGVNMRLRDRAAHPSI